MTYPLSEEKKKGKRRIKKAAVIGSGVMGSSIAAHLANIGIPTLLLDVVPASLSKEEEALELTLHHKKVRNRLAFESKMKLIKQKPAPLTTKNNLHLIEIGNVEDDMEKLSEVDWIIEVIVEKMEVKKHMFEKIDQHRQQGSIVSSNTSGLSVEEMAHGRTDDFCRHFLGTHFFNPPRYLKLIEIIPTKQTSPSVVNFMRTFAENELGKGVVLAKDTPNFIANRIGTFGLLVTVREMIKQQLSIGEIDSITGTLIGRPKSATFRTLDVVGLDTFVHVSNNMYEKVEGEEKTLFQIPLFMKEMFEKGWLGSKTGKGFYQKKGKEIVELNYETMEYENRKKWKSPSIEKAKLQKSTAEKIRELIYSDDQAGLFLWNIIKPVLLYTAFLHKEIADDILAVDQALKWGFGWELGPYELWDAIGVKQSVKRMREEGDAIPTWVEEMLELPHGSFYKKEKEKLFHYDEREYKPVTYNEKQTSIHVVKGTNGVIKKNSGASLLDIGDGIACLEFHSKGNAIGLDVIQMINYTVDYVEQHYEGLVIGNQGKNFCVGANLALMLMEAQDHNFLELDFVVRQFQNAMMKLKYSQKPVVAAPFGMTLGGGTEVCLPASRICASSETYMGLVEVGVGLIPGGGGNKELYSKQLEKLPQHVDIDLEKIVHRVFETIALAKVSTSAHEAVEMGFLHPRDGITFNNDHLLFQAKQTVLSLSRNGYKPPVHKKIPVVGESGYASMVMGAQTMRYSNFISDHDLKIAKKLAYVLAGGNVAKGTHVDEQYLLDIEREAFLSLIGEQKTQERMQYMLMKGKPLRN